VNQLSGDRQPEQPIRPVYRKLTEEITGPSLKSVIEGRHEKKGQVTVAEQFELYNGKVLNEPFTAEMLNDKWNQLLETLDDKPSLKSSLSRRPFLSENGTILLQIDNSVQEEMIRAHNPQLVAWLRSELKNSAIELITEINQVEVQRIAYTDTEKLEEMLRKNRNLAVLKQKFHLDFED
jgi:hypothetical protein